jgi:hypothetical protein
MASIARYRHPGPRPPSDTKVSTIPSSNDFSFSLIASVGLFDQIRTCVIVMSSRQEIWRSRRITVERQGGSLMHRNTTSAGCNHRRRRVFGPATVLVAAVRTEAPVGAQTVEQELGLPISNGATGIQSHEMVLEVNDRIAVFPGINFQPDFHHAFRSNAQANIRDAVVLGCRAQVNF